MAAAESYPDDLRYHREHDWAKIEGGEATFGITWFAQDALGELVHFEAPEEGATLTSNGKAFRLSYQGGDGNDVALVPASRDYYLSEGEPFTTIRNRLGAYVTQLLDLARVPAAADAGSRVVALETRLARAHWTDVQLRDPVATYNKFPVEHAPGLDWDR